MINDSRLLFDGNIREVSTYGRDELHTEKSGSRATARAACSLCSVAATIISEIPSWRCLKRYKNVSRSEYEEMRAKLEVFYSQLRSLHLPEAL